MIDLKPFNKLQKSSTFANRTLLEMEKLHASDVWQTPRPPDIKSLLEEIYPIAMFARNFEVPSRRVAVKYTGLSSTEPDGRMRLSGLLADYFMHRDFFLEVTCAVNGRTESLIRELLSTKGVAFQNPNTVRVGSRRSKDSYIKNEPYATDYNADLTDTTALVDIAIEKKVKKGYPSPCTLIVRVDSGWVLSPSRMCEVAASVRTEDLRSRFAGVYLFCPNTAMCFPVLSLRNPER